MTEQHFERFRARRNRQLVVSGVALLAVLGILYGSEGPGTPVLGIPGQAILPASVVIMLGAVALSFINWRCPACGGYLGKGFNPRFCNRCGAQLRP